MADYYRAHAREEKILPQLQTDSLSDTLSIVVRNERLRELSHLLSGLKEEELDLLRLRNIAELSFAELSQVFSKSEEAVKKSYYRLLTRLQSRLEESNAI
jgi:DNA-directed RNA polymerase specialized sigma24 family protein